MFVGDHGMNLFDLFIYTEKKIEMKIVENIIRMLNGRKELSLADVPEGVCPNCWGRNEYGGAFYNAIKNEGIDINSIAAHVGWVQDYADKHLNDIAIVSDGENSVCNKCKVKYKKVV